MAARPYVLAKVALYNGNLEELSLVEFAFLVDTGASRIVLFLSYDLLPQSIKPLIGTWPRESLVGVAGTDTARNAGVVILSMKDVGGLPVSIETQALCIRGLWPLMTLERDMLQPYLVEFLASKMLLSEAPNSPLITKTRQCG